MGGQMNDEYYTCQICGNPVYIGVPHECPQARIHFTPHVDPQPNMLTIDQQARWDIVTLKEAIQTIREDIALILERLERLEL
jgi:hypothetical protein